MKIEFITENNIQYTVEINQSGTKVWYLNGRLHREAGPAIEWANGNKIWWLNGMRHREDGPAIEWTNGTKYWYLNGKRLPITSNEQFLRFMNLKAFL